MHTLSQNPIMNLKKPPLFLFYLCFFAVLLSCSCTQQSSQNIPNIQFLQGKPLPNAPKADTKPYRFTEDMFAMRNKIFWQALEPFKNKSNIHYLEIGVHEGRALLWVLEHIMTHPTSTLTGIDLFSSGEGDFKPKEIYKNPNDFKQRYFHNIRSSGHENRIQTHIGYSQDVLKTLKKNHYDIMYIDGCHTLMCTREDTSLSWELLKKGGILMIDDYSKEFPDVYQAAQEFYANNADNMEILHTGWVLVIKKLR
ncbi:MAG: hypothetical protein CL916_10395 [Deltaproteobacteria bacterium]|nr:hypothetical protein [Deltaproteobacteria bacterium]